MKLRYLGPFTARTGYARAGHDYLLALVRHIPDLELDIQPTHDFKPEELEDVYKPLLAYVETQGDLNWPDVVLVHSTPFGAERYVTGDLEPDATVRKVVMTTWETDRFPERLAKPLRDNFDVVIAPSFWNAYVFSQADLPATYVRHCYDPEEWVAKSYNLWREEDNDPPYTFYWIGAWCERKNPIGALKAYLTEFTPEDNVRFVIKTGSSPMIAQDIAALKRCLNLGDYPPVELVQGFLSRKELNQFHFDGDCYVSLHRGEGFGLGAFEAACTGNPIIATGWSGTSEFSQEIFETFFMMTPAVVPEYTTFETLPDGRVQGRAVRRDPTGMDGSQNWAEPDLPSAKHLMRVQYGLRTISEAATRYSAGVREGFNYKLIARALVDKLAGEPSE